MDTSQNSHAMGEKGDYLMGEFRVHFDRAIGGMTMHNKDSLETSDAACYVRPFVCSDSEKTIYRILV